MGPQRPKRAVKSSGALDEAARKQAFIKALVGALEARGQQGSSDDLSDAKAAAAFSSLQYDFPIVSVAELASLAQSFRGSVRVKDVFPFHITAKLTANATAGAMQPSVQTPAPLPPGAEREAGEEAAASDRQTAAADALQGAYHQLCGSILLSFVKTLLSLPEAGAWSLLAAYQPALDDDKAPGKEGEEGEGALAQLGAGQEAPPRPSAATAAACDDAPEEGGVEGGDDSPYEDMEPPAASSRPQQPAPRLYPWQRGAPGTLGLAGEPGSIGAGSLPPHLPEGELFSWEALHQRLLHLGSLCSYQVMSHPSVWADSSALATLLDLLRVLGIHDRAPQLHPLLHCYVSLLVDRLADHPADLTCLPQLWEALGVDNLASAPRPSALKQQRQPGGKAPLLPAEAAAALGLVAGLAARYCEPQPQQPGGGRGELQSLSSQAAARQELWRQVHQHSVLGLAARCLEDLASTSASSASQQPEVLASASLICQVLCFYVAHRPGQSDPAKHLMHLGAVRSLSVLLPRLSEGEGGGGAGLEPVRLLALLCVGCSVEVRRWMLAVPAVRAWVEGPTTGAALGPASLEAGHRALWQLLASQLPSQQQQQGEVLLLRLLQCAGADSLPHLHRTLQLMLEVQGVCDGQMSWGAAVQRRLKELGSELRGLAAEGPSGLPEDLLAAASPGEQESCDLAASLQAASLGSEGEEGDTADMKSPLDAGALKVRRARQLAPECLRMLKRLLVANSKAD